jgi:membrane-associated protein
MKIIHEYGYIGLSLITFIESGVFFMLPGDSLLFATGLVAASDTTHNINIYVALVLVIVSSSLGGMCGYAIGTYIDQIHRVAFLKKIFSAARIKIAHEFLEAHGALAIIVCRFVPIARTFTPIVAGIARMNKKKFFIYNFIGACFWASLLLLSSYFLGSMFPNFENYINYIIYGIVIVSVVPIAYKWLQIKMKSK